MKYAIIADIHANWEAFQVVLQDIEKQKCTHIACLGDVVGYNANPKECLDKVRAMNIPTIKGNHDEYCSTDEPLEGFNPHAAEAVNWTRKQLNAEDKKWLNDLKYVRLLSNFTIVHAPLDGPQRWGYVFETLAAAASFIIAELLRMYHGGRQCWDGDVCLRASGSGGFKIEAKPYDAVEIARAGVCGITPLT